MPAAAAPATTVVVSGAGLVDLVGGFGGGGGGTGMSARAADAPSNTSATAYSSTRFMATALSQVKTMRLSPRFVGSSTVRASRVFVLAGTSAHRHTIPAPPTITA